MTKLFLIPRQVTTITETWERICPNCKNIVELSKSTDYDMTIRDREYSNEKIMGFDYSNPTNIIMKNVCSNCGNVFNND